MGTNGEQTSDFDEVLNTAMGNSSPSSSTTILSWKKHGGYMLWTVVKTFVTGPQQSRPKSKDSRFKFIAEQVISSLQDNADEVVVKTSKELLSQHRTIEDTEARRRLEHWACWTIIIYLIGVFVLVILNGLSRIIWSGIFESSGFISDMVMNVILSTTTVNIIGLGLIVLRGHFPSKDNEQKKKSESRNE